MRPLLLSLSLILHATPFLTLSKRAFAAQVPPLNYPICRRNFTCAPPYQQDFRTIMADLKQEEMCDTINKLAEPASAQSQILEKNEVREEAVKEMKAEASKVPVKKEEVKLPKLSAAEFRAYNSMAEHMEYFHNHFRQSWTLLYTACETNKRPSNLSLKQFLSTGLQFCSHLSTHHAIEEQHIFPVLAQKMPEFKQGKNAAELLRQHKEIHKGMDAFEEYLEKCRRGETELQLSVLKEKMDSWGTVLWTHLEQEVRTLGAENMRKYWTIEEIKRMPM